MLTYVQRNVYLRNVFRPGFVPQHIEFQEGTRHAAYYRERIHFLVILEIFDYEKRMRILQKELEYQMLQTFHRFKQSSFYSQFVCAVSISEGLAEMGLVHLTQSS